MTKSHWLRLIIVLVLTGAIALGILYRDMFNQQTLQAWLNNMGPWAAVIFILIYIIAPTLFLPGSILTLAGGALFGPIWGTFYSLTAATIGATIAFLISRYLASDWVTNKTGGRLKQLIDGVEQEGWRFVAFVRLVPIFPFNLLNYALGLTRIKLSHYIIASYICMFPGALAYSYIGYAGREALAGGEGLIQKALLALGLLALIAFLPRIIKRVRNKAAEK